MKEEKTIVSKRFMPTLHAIAIATDMEEIKKNGKYKFPMYINKELMATDIDHLELSVRASNCLKRIGIHTIGELVEQIECDDDLKKIKSCGKTSITEIMCSLLCFQYECLGTERKKKYIERLKELNLVK